MKEKRIVDLCLDCQRVINLFENEVKIFYISFMNVLITQRGQISDDSLNTSQTKCFL